MENEMLNKLASYGCNVSNALEDTFMGNEAFHVKILRRLPENQCLHKMRAASEMGDAKALFAASHELKGVYATMGLTPLYDKCCEIVEISRAGSTEGTLEKMPALEAAHAEVLKIVVEG